MMISWAVCWALLVVVGFPLYFVGFCAWEDLKKRL